MGLREERLKNITKKLFNLKSIEKPTTTELLNSKYSDLIFSTYKALDGKLDSPPARFGKWDISCDKFIIELDEERHFNRYRSQTLQSIFYKDYLNFSINKYKSYCEDKEIDCLKSASWSKSWKTKSTEIQFGLSDDNGILSVYGSSRWKQRAYYDFLKDISGHVMNIPLLRISIYDNFNGLSIDKLLKLNDESLLIQLINSRLSGF